LLSVDFESHWAEHPNFLNRLQDVSSDNPEIYEY
jgi:hypothetical protein